MPTNIPATDTVFIRFLGFGDSQTGFLTARFSNPTTGAIDSNEVYKTSDGGQTWFRHRAPIPNNILFIAQVDSWHVTAAVPAFLTAPLARLNAGQWTTQSITPVPGNTVPELTVFTDQLMFASSFSADGTTQILFETQDGGANWNQIATVPFTV